LFDELVICYKEDENWLSMEVVPSFVYVLSSIELGKKNLNVYMLIKIQILTTLPKRILVMVVYGLKKCLSSCL
jgi:hypothetical protein